jgi:uncharacterized membrane protein YczE
MDLLIYIMALVISVVVGVGTILYFILTPYKGWKDDD